MPWPKGRPKSPEQRAKIAAGLAVAREEGRLSSRKGTRQPAELIERRIAPLRGRHREITCGHPDRKHGAKGLCKSCYMVEWMRLHPDANSGNAWSRANPDRARYLRRRGQLKKHGITPEQYAELHAQQGGRCANNRCGVSFPVDSLDYRSSALHVDHDHATGLIRGLLCRDCNAALGHAKDDQERLAGLIEYLRAHTA